MIKAPVPDALSDYLRAHRNFKTVEERLGEIEREYEAAIDAQHAAMLDVARLDNCPTCHAAAAYPCMFNTGDLSSRLVPTMHRVHEAREKRAQVRLKALGVFP